MAETGQRIKILKSIAVDFAILLIMILPILLAALIWRPTGVARSWVYFLPLFALIAVLNLVKHWLDRRRQGK
jgi:hypothetical protein